ncbi:LysR family transcriptional regulator [Umezawaea sp. Da 62-37]|uniref:LysR family transcriptional regulator n=1 Tax=Umezawaea sp. Da 62-37 TaxID=3075927 RepID=UPI0028F6F09E|nr:LysR family transcriptional regulator [Umezawaea sp. Da 62-37]WNV86962.1 LysR family transcriptional regulator [Umezawaea sp. Da 62-37]
MRLELRHLHVVLAVAAAGSIRRAAMSLKIAQPGLTAQLRRIERTFGGQLFVRAPNGVELTDLGEHVVLRAQEVVDKFDDLCATARKIAERSQPASIQLGGVTGALIPQLVSAVREVLPEQDITSQMERTGEAVMDHVRTEKLDLAVMAEFARTPRQPPFGVLRRPLLTEPVFVALPAGHRLADRAELDLTDLSDEWWTMPEESVGGPRSTFQLTCEAAGFTPRFAHFGADLDTALELVRSENTVAGVHPTIHDVAGIVVKPLFGNPLHRRLVLVWPETSALADVIDRVHAGFIAGYLRHAQRSALYSRWWNAGGEEFARDSG